MRKTEEADLDVTAGGNFQEIERNDSGPLIERGADDGLYRGSCEVRGSIPIAISNTRRPARKTRIQNELRSNACFVSYATRYTADPLQLARGLLRTQRCLVVAFVCRHRIGAPSGSCVG